MTTSSDDDALENAASKGPASTGSVAVLRDPDVVAGVLHPLRRELLALLDEPDSAVGLARRLELPRQRVNYHLRALEDLGLVVEVEQRQRRGAVERIMARRDAGVLVDPTVLGGLDASDRGPAAAATAAGIDVARRAVAVGRAAAAAGERLASLTIDAEVRVADPAALAALRDELAGLLARHDAGDMSGAMRFRVTTVALPEMSTTTEERP